MFGAFLVVCTLSFAAWFWGTADSTTIVVVRHAEKELAAYARRGLQATRAINPGEILQEGVNFAVLRPGQQKLGVHPRHLLRIEGHAAARVIPLGSGLSLDDVTG